MRYVGSSQVQTPTFGRFARHGFEFQQTYTNTPVCAPGRANLWTGRHIHRHGVLSNAHPLPLAKKTLAQYLDESAVPYRRGYIGKWHLDSLGTMGRDPEGGVPRYVPAGPRRFEWDWWRGINAPKNNWMKGFPSSIPTAVFATKRDICPSSGRILLSVTWRRW